MIGLLEFDVKNIDDSVPALLVGLKIAFSTSIVGMSAAIVFRSLQTFAPTHATSSGVTPEDIHSVLTEIRNENLIQAAEQDDHLTKLRNAIATEGDSSLLTQIQKFRTTVQDGQSELIREFREFATHMVENNQKAIIEALESVIRDFNQNLTEQFGENFKQLNEAVAALVGWQDRYKDHVEKMEARLATAVEAIEATRVALEAVREHTAAIPDAVKQLEPALSGMTTQTQSLAGHLDAVAGLRDKAVEAFPVIEANLKKITDDLTRNVETAVKQSTEALERQRASQEALSSGFETLLAQAGTAQEAFTTELKRALDEMNRQTATEFNRHGDLIEASAKEAQNSIAEAWKKTEEAINGQMAALDEQMQQELSRSLEVMGRNLASISEKFVTDYTPLTDRLRDLVAMSGRTG